ncbi:tyrosine-protein phosphatase [Streptomyces sp. NPDC050743]|uniref:tyrosine-protein phosphatase n=1 Tax=Streptomyces sp. NPDC050743 TaxID=3365634 RepID=UPI003796B140
MPAARIRRTARVVLCVVALGALPAYTTADTTAQRAVSTSYDDTATVHRIALQGAVNVRDLGGYRTDKGRQVRYGQVFRSDALGRSTEADVSTLAALNLRTVVDFRVPLEVQRDGADRRPAGAALTSRPVDDLGCTPRPWR